MSLSGRFQGWLPLLLMGTLIVALGAFTATKEEAFLTSFNLNNLLLLSSRSCSLLLLLLRLSNHLCLLSRRRLCLGSGSDQLRRRRGLLLLCRLSESSQGRGLIILIVGVIAARPE